ncbi:MAG: beta-lactamase family protein [Thermomicrobiales bacterium]|nr:beta-lactamase family protein [Thermomicrobiales bacterium]
MTAPMFHESQTQSIDAQALATIELLFREQLSSWRLFPGAALAVYRGDQKLLDLVDGYADTQRGDMVDHASLFPLFSGSKPFAAVALWQQIERGRISLDDRVADYWPAFGKKGKDAVLVRHVLTHRGGFPQTPPNLPPASWGDANLVLTALENLDLEFPPGSVSAYHFLTQHWVIAELIRRLDGRTYESYLRDEITGPLDLANTFLSLPAELEHRCVKLHATDGSDDWSLEILRFMHGAPIYRTAIPGGSLVSTAVDMARFYAAIAMGGEIGGARILRAETVDRILQIEVDAEIDPSFDLPVRRAFGFEIGGLDEPRRHWPGATSTTSTFWHGGLGSSVCWADRDSGLVMVFLSNGLRRDSAGAIARRDLSDLVRTCLEAPARH